MTSSYLNIQTGARGDTILHMQATGRFKSSHVTEIIFILVSRSRADKKKQNNNKSYGPNDTILPIMVVILIMIIICRLRAVF